MYFAIIKIDFFWVAAYYIKMDTEKFNTYASMVFVELSFTSKNFAKTLIGEFKELSSGFSGLIATPSAESQKHLQTLFHHNEEKLKSFLHDYLKNNSGEFNWTTFLDKYDVYQVAGKFFKIDKTETAYMEFVKRMRTERWVFSYMSVATDADNYTIFFA